MTVSASQHAAAAPGPSAATRLLVALFRESPVPIGPVDVRSRRVVKANASPWKSSPRAWTARSLVRELLAYAGRQPVEMRTFAVNELIAEHEDTLREELLSDIGLLVRPCAGPALVHADPERLREILLHLVEQLGGSIRATSRAGVGTSLRVYLPRGEGGDSPAQALRPRFPSLPSPIFRFIFGLSLFELPGSDDPPDGSRHGVGWW